MLKKIILFILIFTNFSLFAGEPEILPFDKIRPGMKGYGLTVFKGNKIEKFDVEVIAVLKNKSPKSGIILIKLLKNDVIDKAGVIAGMSGSPVYINNKLIGALSTAFPYSKEPFAGVTPIEDMLKIYELDMDNSSFNFEPDNNRTFAQAGEGSESMQIIKTPLVFHDTSQKMIDTFKGDLKKMNFLPFSSSAGGWDYEVPKKFEPGSAVGVNLITGDLNIGAIGTVTHVDKEKLLIFGHPFFQSGKTDMPLAHAYIHTVIPSLAVSFKMGSITKIRGRVYQDQASGVAGILNKEAKMIPIKVDLDYFNNRDSFNYNIIRSYYYFPLFLNMAISSSLEMLGGDLEKNTIYFTFNIKFNNNKTITLKDTYSSLSTRYSMMASTSYLMSPIINLLSNEFEDVQINNVDIKIKLDNTIKIAEIKKVSANKKQFRPGEKIKLKVKLKPYQGRPFYKSISITLPPNLPEGNFSLFVSSDKERQFIDYMFSGAKYQPQNMEHMIKLYNSLAKLTDLSVWAVLRDKSIIAQDQVMENLPSSYYSILRNSLETGMQRSMMQIKNKIQADYIIVGSAILSIKIKKDLR